MCILKKSSFNFTIYTSLLVTFPSLSFPLSETLLTSTPSFTLQKNNVTHNYLEHGERHVGKADKRVRKETEKERGEKW